MARASGTVKWFSQEKGFGFVTREDGSDVFVHHSGISGRGFKTLEQGERVEFDVIEEPKGLKASNLTRLDQPGEGDGRCDGRSDGYGGRDDGYGNRGGHGYGGARDAYGSANAERDDNWGNRAGAGRDW
jgi:CspA family cold shock protein